MPRPPRPTSSPSPPASRGNNTNNSCKTSERLGLSSGFHRVGTFTHGTREITLLLRIIQAQPKAGFSLAISDVCRVLIESLGYITDAP
jgi:hypothetical protein